MTTNSSVNWHEFKRTILLKLNIPAEFQALGLELANGATPNNHGWIQAHCFGIQDRTPSAGICVADTHQLGLYNDFRNPGLSGDLFNFAVRVKGCTRGEAFKHYAKKVGEKMPGEPDERKLDNLVISGEPTASTLLGYAEKKAGYTIRAMQEVGVLWGSWSKKQPIEHRQFLYIVAMFGSSAFHELEPTGYHCFADQYGRMIRQYCGKDNPPDLIPSMTLGNYGPMGVDGLKRLAEATTVHFVEGISDLIATQAVLGPWRDGATEGDPRKHVVLATGGCKNIIKVEWVHHFADKDVFLWPDVGDKAEEGVRGMEEQAYKLLPVVKSLTIVMLPRGKDGGKNDVRAWLTEEGTARGMVELLAYAATFKPLEKGDKTNTKTGSQNLLIDLGLQVLGEHEGSKMIEVYSEKKKKRQTIPELNRFSIHNLTQLIGEETVQEHVTEAKDPVPDMVRMSDVKNAIADAASDKPFRAEQVHGAGPWLIEEQIVLVKTREIGLVKGDKIETSSIPFYEGWILDTSQATGDWVDFDVLSRHLAEAQRDEWCQGVFTEAELHFAKWPWKQAPAPKIVASLVICSWLQTMWDWRPEIFLTGGSDTGKSMLIGEVLAPLFGNLALYVHKPTEAAIRQHVQHHGKIILIDEFEHDKHRQKVLELFRTSSRGGLTIRGTSDQKGVSFQLRHIPWFAAIETGLKKQPDKNRFVILDLNEIPADKRGKINLPTADQLRDLGLRLLAVGLRHFHRAKAFALDLRGYQIDGVPGRCVETYGVPCGMFSAIFGHRLNEAQTNMRTWLAAWDFATQSERDHVILLQAIYTSEVDLDHGKHSTVSALLAKQVSGIDHDATEALARVGIKRVVKRNGDVMIYFLPSVVSRQLRGTEFENQLSGQFLLRFDGAKNGIQQRMGAISPRGIEIPESTVEKQLGHKDGDNDPDDADASTRPDRQSGEDGADGEFKVAPRKMNPAAGLAETASSQADADHQTA